MKIKNIIGISILSILLMACTQGVSDNAKASVGHAGTSAQHVVASTAHGSAASVQAASAVVAIPLKFVGMIGKAADVVSNNMLEVSMKPIPISEENIVAGPAPKAE